MQIERRIIPQLSSCLVFAVIALSTGCKQEAGSMPAQPVPQVEVVTVQTQVVPDEPEFIGRAEASRPVEIVI